MTERLSDGSVWASEPGRIVDGTTADQACEFTSRYISDIDLLADMNLNAFRFSFNWAALFPEEKTSEFVERQLREETVDYYLRLLDHLKSRGVKTFGTLFHFCSPRWLANYGGWTSDLAAEEFARFTEKVADRFSGMIDYWITINEPMAFAYQSYIAGIWTPGHSNDFVSAFTAVRNFLSAHALAYECLKSKDDRIPVSYANHWRPFTPENALSPLDQTVSLLRDTVFNHLFPKSVQNGRFELPGIMSASPEIERLQGEIKGLKNSIDFLAANYYTRELSRFKLGWPIDLFGVVSDKPRLKTNSLGWEVYPDGLYNLLTRDLRPYMKAPDGRTLDIFITENGFADSHGSDCSEGPWSLEDPGRVDYLVSHLMAVHRAIANGAPVKGYLHWSLLDNFEWAEGLTPRFGLVRVSYPTQERTLRQSARVYSEIARLNGVDPAMLLIRT
jgi:beta-glucosidase